MGRNNRSETSEELIRLLKVEGPLTTTQLTKRLGISPPAVRQHTARLMGEGLIQMVERRRAVGRPAHRWSLTGVGHSRFPDAHADATVRLIAAVRSALGEDALDTLLTDWYDADLQTYEGRMAGAESLAERVERLCELRTEQGYMAEVHSDATGYLFIENHCPICAAAEVCQGFCANELALFRATIGPGARIVRIEHLIGGDRRCAYRIEPDADVCQSA